MISYFIKFIFVSLFIFLNFAWAKSDSTSLKSNVDLRKLALPSEVKNISKSSGAIYYSPSVKGKVLVPVNFWGAVGQSGLHFIPADTNLISGLSLAGGPSTQANFELIKLTRLENNILKTKIFSLADGGSTDVYKVKLKAGDTVFVAQDNFFQNRAYYTSLIGVISTILSSVIIYDQIKKLP